MGLRNWSLTRRINLTLEFLLWKVLSVNEKKKKAWTENWRGVLYKYVKLSRTRHLSRSCPLKPKTLNSKMEEAVLLFDKSNWTEELIAGRPNKLNEIQFTVHKPESVAIFLSSNRLGGLSSCIYHSIMMNREREDAVGEMQLHGTHWEVNGWSQVPSVCSVCGEAGPMEGEKSGIWLALHTLDAHTYLGGNTRVEDMMLSISLHIRLADPSFGDALVISFPLAALALCMIYTPQPQRLIFAHRSIFSFSRFIVT